MNENMKKDLRALLKQVIQNNGGNCSVCNQHIDTGMTSFANLHGIKVSWGRRELTLYTPREITFTVPYIEIKNFTIQSERKHMGIELENRILITIRELQ